MFGHIPKQCAGIETKIESSSNSEITDPADFYTVTSWLETVKENRNYATKHTSMLLDTHIAKMVPLKLWPSIKEFTECAAAYDALNTYMQRHDKAIRGNRKIVCYVIGDGQRPQASAIIARYARWKIYAIDPILRVSVFEHKVPGVTMYAQKSEDFKDIIDDAPISVIVAVHSHGGLSEFWHRLPKSSIRIAVAIPCCVPQYIEGVKPIESFIDLGISFRHNDGHGMNGVVIWEEKAQI